MHTSSNRRTKCVIEPSFETNCAETGYFQDGVKKNRRLCQSGLVAKNKGRAGLARPALRLNAD